MVSLRHRTLRSADRDDAMANETKRNGAPVGIETDGAGQGRKEGCGGMVVSGLVRRGWVGGGEDLSDVRKSARRTLGTRRNAVGLEARGAQVQPRMSQLQASTVLLSSAELGKKRQY